VWPYGEGWARAVLIAGAGAPAAEAQAPKKVTFSGGTRQTTVAKTARQIEFRVKAGGSP
jgi:hypothetical protein